jgi:hypothetical protein
LRGKKDQPARLPVHGKIPPSLGHRVFDDEAAALEHVEGRLAERPLRLSIQRVEDLFEGIFFPVHEKVLTAAGGDQHRESYEASDPSDFHCWTGSHCRGNRGPWKSDKTTRDPEMVSTPESPGFLDFTPLPE